jgi:hypothetical protein
MSDSTLLAKILVIMAAAGLGFHLSRGRSGIQGRPQSRRNSWLPRVLAFWSRKMQKETWPVRQSANYNRSVDFGAKANLSRVTLSRIPSLFGRLAYFASLRDPAAGEYQHWGMSEIYGHTEASKAFRESHAEVFSEWLSLDFAQRQADFGLYRSGLDADGSGLLEAVARLEPQRHYLPESARQAEREAFQGALIALLEVVRQESMVPLSHTYACLVPLRTCH